MSESNIRYDADFSGNIIGEKEGVTKDKWMLLPDTSFNHILYTTYRDKKTHGYMGVLCIKCNEKIKIGDGYLLQLEQTKDMAECYKCGSRMEFMTCPYKYFGKDGRIMLCCGLIVTNNNLDVKIRYENAKCSENHELKMCKLCYKKSINYNRIIRITTDTYIDENSNNETDSCYNLITNLENEWCDDCKKLVKFVYNTSKTNYINIEATDYRFNGDYETRITPIKLLLGIKGLCQKIKMLEEMIEFAPGEDQMLQAQQRFKKSASVNDDNK